ncbi:small integral membrane protein 4 [Orussus abietinus]|uniref:small integral membrane protein 4 n=1 Tax=Orussus abietinus TaxID=222816 RepID=UPI0006269346|nr:small integral membrane protein 4 [Orussus abietinus]
MMLYSRRLKRIIRNWPGFKTFGEYCFLPVFFFLGAGIEFAMINWKPGQVNFYDVYKRKAVEKAVEQKLREQVDRI